VVYLVVVTKLWVPETGNNNQLLEEQPVQEKWLVGWVDSKI
jgi:hypothetical protein